MLKSPPRSSILLTIALLIFIDQSSCVERTLTHVDFASNVRRENTQYGLFADAPLHRSRRQADDAKDLINKFTKQFNTTDVPEFPEEISNEQLKELTKNNPAANFTDHYTYYNVSYTNGGSVDQYWVNMKDSKDKDAVRHEMLSNAHRRAATVRLSFKFPFYGYKVENITIATGGFLFLGEAVHTWSVVTLITLKTF